MHEGEEHQSVFAIGRMCRVMNVSTRGLRAFRKRTASSRQRSDLVTLAHIKEQSRPSPGGYGPPRMTEELKEIGLHVWHRRVGRLMRRNGMSVARTRKHKATTIAAQYPAVQCKAELIWRRSWEKTAASRDDNLRIHQRVL